MQGKPRNVWLSCHNKGRGTFALLLKWKSGALSNNNNLLWDKHGKKNYEMYGNQNEKEAKEELFNVCIYIKHEIITYACVPFTYGWIQQQLQGLEKRRR